MGGAAAVLEMAKPIAKAKKGRAGAAGGRKEVLQSTRSDGLIHGDWTMSTITTIPSSKSATTLVPDEERGVMPDVSWEFYDRLSDAVGEQSHIRMAYDGKDLEIMTLGPKHEQSRGLLGSFIEAVAEGLEVDFRPAGSTTWKRAAKRRRSRVRSVLLLPSHQARSQRRGGRP